jgi:hypothetical protein
MLRTLFSATILAGALAGSAMAQAPDAGEPGKSDIKRCPVFLYRRCVRQMLACCSSLAPHLQNSGYLGATQSV